VFPLKNLHGIPFSGDPGAPLVAQDIGRRRTRGKREQTGVKRSGDSK